MKLNELTAISPIDGRYRSKVSELAPYFSEFALMKYRVSVEIKYFMALRAMNLGRLKDLDIAKSDAIHKIAEEFDENSAREIKEIEKETNHDVKAVEYYLKNALDGIGLSDFREFVHFGLTSQDINNTAVPMSLKAALDEVLLPRLDKVCESIFARSNEWKSRVMISRTHGQPASPTTLGKEFGVFVERINNQLEGLKKLKVYAKFGGASGNLNAHVVAFPEVNWIEFCDKFIEELGLVRQHTTTQIEHYDNLAAVFDNFCRINNILIDFSRDVWLYISLGYFSQQINKGEVGSSAMPHKVNPIDFENAEGNLGLANSMFGYMSAKLPVSRLQRDLSDSTVLRNIGLPFAHTLIAYDSLNKGISKLLLNEIRINEDLNNNWSVLAEAIQTVLRREGLADPYEKLKELTRNNESISERDLHVFIESLDISPNVKTELKNLSPITYTGYSTK